MENDFKKAVLIEKKYPNIWKWRNTRRSMFVCAQTVCNRMIKESIEMYEKQGEEVLDFTVIKSEDGNPLSFVQVHFLLRNKEADRNEKNDISAKEIDVALEIVKQIISDMQGRYIVDSVILSAKDREEINIKVTMFEKWRHLVSRQLFENRLIDELYEAKSRDEIEGMSLAEILELRDSYLGRG